MSLKVLVKCIASSFLNRPIRRFESVFQLHTHKQKFLIYIVLLKNGTKVLSRVGNFLFPDVGISEIQTDDWKINIKVSYILCLKNCFASIVWKILDIDYVGKPYLKKLKIKRGFFFKIAFSHILFRPEFRILMAYPFTIRIPTGAVEKYNQRPLLLQLF